MKLSFVGGAQRPKMKLVAMVAAGALVLGLLVWAVMGMLGGKSERHPEPPKITLVSPPPPPPPPPAEKKPDPPKEQKEVKVEQPAPKPVEAPPSADLKMEGPAGNGPSAFGAGKIASDDLSKLGNGKSGLFNPFNNYANLLKGELQRYLAKNADLRRRRYAIDVRIWVDKAGNIQRFELVGSTGDEDVDQKIKHSIDNLQHFTQAPPADMALPIRLRIVTHG